jgi:hypothetical protein
MFRLSYLSHTRVCNKSNTTVQDVEQKLITLPEHLISLPDFSGVRVARSLFFCVMFCRSLFVHLIFFAWPLYCLSFLYLRLLISSNFHYSVIRQHELFLIVRMQIKRVIVFNATFNNISVISRNIVENHRSLASPQRKPPISRKCLTNLIT